MALPPNLPIGVVKTIDECIPVFKENLYRFERLARSIAGAVADNPGLRPFIHSVKHRAKDPDHLRDKLVRQYFKAKENNRQFSITPKNVITKITDLSGVRILHLHTEQSKQIDAGLRKLLFEEMDYVLHEGPKARTWDDEYRQLFSSFGIGVMKSASLYTSIHYVVLQSRKTRLACEIQVRTLMEEVWGEVSHTINYPHPTDDLPCKEQIKVLARATSSCTRLVDSIFRSHNHASRTRNS